MNTPISCLSAIILSLTLAACDDSGGIPPAPTITSFELLDPNPIAGNGFGDTVRILANGNIVVSVPNDSSVTPSNGAIHLYNPLTQKRIVSIYGDTANDALGSSGITALANSNFVIASSSDDEGGIVDAGTVRLVNGTTGIQIGNTMAGDTASDQLGSAGVTALANSNFVIVSPVDDGIITFDAGSVRLMNGTTGVQISAFLGDSPVDQLGLNGVVALANDHFVIASSNDDDGGLVNVGSVRLVNGTTGVQIGSTILGNLNNDRLGLTSITVLSNNNFVIVSDSDTEGGISAAGSVRLVNGATGVQLGSPIVGDSTNDRFGLGGITVLANDNFVILSPTDTVAGILNAGSVRLVNGATGMQIGSTIEGDIANDLLGFGGCIALANNNFAFVSMLDDESGLVDAGSVRLVNGTTGVQIGSTIVGDIASDQLGSNGIVALANSNFVVVSSSDDSGSIVDAGSVRLVNGATGMQIGSTIAGNTASDQLGSDGVTPMANNNVVIASSFDDEGGLVDVGSVRLLNGTTGVQIGNTIAGDSANDFLGLSGITVLANNNIVIASEFDNEGGIVDAGSVRLVDGATGTQVGNTIAGNTTDDMIGAAVISSSTGDFYILSLKNADNNNLTDSGLVRLITQ